MMELVLQEVIIPAMLKCREDVLREPWAAGCKPDFPIIFSFDGEQSHLDAVMKLLVYDVPAKWASHNIRLLKFAAATSMTQQPCDVAPMFRSLKALLGSAVLPADAGEYHTFFKATIFKDMDPASCRVFSNALSKLGSVIAQAFSEKNIREGWSIAGLWPLDTQVILARCTLWPLASEEQQSAIKAAIPELVQVAQKMGEVSDAAMQSAIGTAINLRRFYKEKLGRDLAITDTYALNRRRAIWCTHALAATRELARQVVASASTPIKSARKAKVDLLTATSTAPASAQAAPVAVAAPAAPTASPVGVDPAHMIVDEAQPVATPKKRSNAQPASAAKEARTAPAATPAMQSRAARGQRPAAPSPPRQAHI
eukprot:m.147004 g.147004  ORF g.147004 m.147004 type:complete len:369 (+) comp9700_c0_seq22:741-1847(+)